MFNFVLEIFKLNSGDEYFSFYIFFFLLSWLFFIIRLLPGLIYYKKNEGVNISSRKPFGLIIPVVDESIEDFSKVLKSISNFATDADQLIVVQNGSKNNLKEISQKFGFSYVYINLPSKRTAIVEGLKHITEDRVILVDSDSIWHSDCFKYFHYEFLDPKVGGVTSNQFIKKSGKKFQEIIVNRYGSILEYIRNSLSFRSQSVFGQIGCLPGRTIAFRTSIIKNCVNEFLNDTFLGHRIEFSDDRFLTNKTLLNGYKTVYCHNARVETFAPSTIIGYYKQQMRWARGSQINNSRTLLKYIKHDLWYIFLIFFIDTILPFIWLGFMIGSLIQTVFIPDSSSMFNFYELIIFTSLSVYSTFLIKYGLFSDMLEDLGFNFFRFAKYILYFTIGTVFFMTPVRVWGFITMVWNLSWGTRLGSYRQTGSNRNFMLKLLPSIIGFVFLLLNIALVLIN